MWGKGGAPDAKPASPSVLLLRETIGSELYRLVEAIETFDQAAARIKDVLETEREVLKLRRAKIIGALTAAQGDEADDVHVHEQTLNNIARSAEKEVT